MVAALDAAVAAEVIVAGRRDCVAGWLLTPYLAWSLFATALTAAVEDPTAQVGLTGVQRLTPRLNASRDGHKPLIRKFASPDPWFVSEM